MEPMPGPILALDTSGSTASVAVYAERVLAETSWHSGRRHSAQLLPEIDHVLRLAEVDKHQLSGIAVARGPGSYSGLRVGISTAMALALSLEVDLVQVPTLDVMAWAVAGGRVGPRSIRAAIDVGRGHFATARLRPRLQPGLHPIEGHVEHETEIESLALPALLDRAAAEGAVLVVDLDPETRRQATEQSGSRIDWASPAGSLRRAGFLAELAAGKFRRGELVGAASVEPIYMSS